MRPVRGFYAILDAGAVRFEDLDGLATRAGRLLAGAPCWLQLRAKGATALAMRAACERLLPLCRAAQVPFCVNDRLDVALAVGADAVHLGQEDLPLADARRVRELAGRPDLAIGFSTHNRAQAMAAAAAGADYLGFGPIFETSRKANPDPIVGLEALAEVCALLAPRPIVAIGGITLDRVASVARAGAAAAALIAAVEAAPDSAAAARRVGAAFPLR